MINPNLKISIMQRDGKNRSIWQEVVSKASTANPHIKQYSVIIIGGGITGMTTALQLQEQKKSCVILEANQIGFGTTSGTSAHLNTVLDTPYSQIIKQHGIEKAKEVLESAREAIAHISRNIEHYQISCDFMTCSGYMYAEDEEQEGELMEIKKAIHQVGIACEEVFETPLPVGCVYAIKFEEQGRFHPTKYLMGLQKAFVALGGQVIENTLVQQVQEEHHRFQVKTADGQVFLTDAVVYATHTPPGVQFMNLRLVPYRSYIQVWELDEREIYPRDLVYDMKDPFHYFRTVLYKGKSCLMVGGQDHKTAHHDNEQQNFLELEAFVKKLFSVKRKLYQWSSQYYESQDSLPFIGYYPGKGQRNEFIATGFGGNGMIFGTLSGRMITNLIQEGKCNYQELYAPARIGPIAAFQDVLREQTDVVKHFVQDRCAVERIEGFAEMSRGEGKVLKYEGERIGLFKDENGKVFGVNPVCRHISCIVKWNNAEQSWDCPCHGARYAADGNLLNGPAVAPLKRWNFRADELLPGLG
ncbi:FAD-dependent oxidoreductase [Sphingobacterium sp. SRCM116780]|uniref:FAD-dependent oxidoreductase n=1 Tax=Sphingobacterium sp. SRCM116780 TaxID=2907623 RepID=UPI001F3A06DB|nr:FAD-dependent oxidoreductase [Sphingobacterium sp. SRCM116780]UIR54742.1 FAD-dependent oxidoreductase [Sphingobacterium sp. SRCM116780]